MDFFGGLIGGGFFDRSFFTVESVQVDFCPLLLGFHMKTSSDENRFVPCC